MNGLVLVKVYFGLTYLLGGVVQARPLIGGLADFPHPCVKGFSMNVIIPHPLNVIHSLWVEIPLNGFSHLLNHCSDYIIGLVSLAWFHT